MSNLTIIAALIGSIGLMPAHAAALEGKPKNPQDHETHGSVPPVMSGGPTFRQASTLWGTGGLIMVPSAFTSAHKDWVWHAGLTKDFSVAGLRYGLLRDIEVGGTFLDRKNADNKFIANAKVHIVPANFEWFKLGIGVMDAADAVNQTVYFVGSADLLTPDYASQRGAVGMRAHAGVGTGYFSEKPFGGAELFFDRGFSILGEWDTKNFNFGARYAHEDEFFVELGNYSTRLSFKMSYGMRF